MPLCYCMARLFHSAGRIQKVDLPYGSILCTAGFFSLELVELLVGSFVVVLLVSDDDSASLGSSH